MFFIVGCRICFVSPEYISALYDEGSFVAFFSRALLFFSVSLFLYGFADDFQKSKWIPGNRKFWDLIFREKKTFEIAPFSPNNF